MKTDEHVVSVYPVNVPVIEGDPRTFGWAFRCTCMRGKRRASVGRMDRSETEALAQKHLASVGAVREATS